MLYPRIIPCLLIHDRGLVKTVRFTDPRYVGDPVNAVRIFNEKEVDELIVLDIDASVRGREPDYQLIGNLAAECRMPFCYGGGIKTLSQAQKIFSLGVEKIAISSAAIDNPGLVGGLAERVGRQSVVVVLDVKKSEKSGKYTICTGNGKKDTGIEPVSFALEAEKSGAGELLINSVDNDGTMQGFDMDLLGRIMEVVHIPVTVLGGAGSISDIKSIISRFGIIGVAAGSLFVFKGKYRAVLINYPDREAKDLIMKESFNFNSNA
jgi:imidazole glycerol-phosphate synthase subunit HisF